MPDRDEPPSERDNRVGEAVAWYYRAAEDGRSPNPTDFLARFPDLRPELESFLAGYHVHYADRLVCTLWAEVTGRAERRGLPIQVADAWIAATALVLGVRLLTNNPADFKAVDGLTVISAPLSE